MVKRTRSSTGLFATETLSITDADRLTQKDSAALREMFQGMQLDVQLEAMRDAALQCLSRNGQPTSWPEVMTTKDRTTDPLLLDCADIVFYARATAGHVESGNARDAAWCALRLANAHMRASLRQWEPAAVTGSKVRAGRYRQRSETAASTAERKAEWQRLANQIRKANPRLSKLALAQRIRDHLRYHVGPDVPSVHTIRQAIR